ncbi:MAG: LysR substrate-binding domain-containing protein, partial [Thiotrichales bacterium]|nr:LysR substrate-binding domain-containing protein [Thiotrichales bacterium]
CSSDLPRLDRFRRRHPDIEVRIDGTDRLVDVAGGEVDVALRYGPGNYRGVQVDFLFDQLNTPVCSPVLLEGENALMRPEDLRHHTLLHIVWKDADASWRMWLMAAGLHGVDPTRGPHFTQEGMAVQAALDGQGVPLVGDRLVADHLSAGRLVCPFDRDLKTPLKFSYFLLSGANGATRTKVAAFRDWLLGEVQRHRIDSETESRR